MITAVDTNVLLDLFLGDPRHGPASRNWLRDAYDRGAILVCDIVYAELAPAFRDCALLDQVLRAIGVNNSPVNTPIAYEACLRWRQYRDSGGPRARIISDFLIGAHALASADVFLTRDRGFYSTYFPELRGSGEYSEP